MRSQPLSAVSPLTTSWFKGPLAALERDWSGLVDPRLPGSVFRSFPWISSWWSAASTSTEARVLLMRRGDALVGLLPMYQERTRFGGRRLRLMGDGIVGSDWLGLVARPDQLDELAPLAAQALLADGADELQLDDLADDDPLVKALRAQAKKDAITVEPRYKCPFIRVDGSFENFLKQLPDGIGQQFHRRKKWLEKQPGYRLETLTKPDDVAQAMKVLFDLHRQRWALEGGSDAIDGPRVERFHVAAAQKLAESGVARLWLLHVDGAPRAALYGWVEANRLVFYQAGHEPAWRPRSVGTVLLGLVIKSAFDEKLAEFDFLRGEEPYKLKWATGFRHTVRVRVRGAGLRPLLDHTGRALWLRLKAGAQAALPETTFAWLKAARKKLERGHAA